MTRLWPPVAATSVGSFPGTDVRETARLVAGELPELIHLAELPDRGPGADIIGRTGSLLAGISSEFVLETTPLGWRLSPAQGLNRTMRRAASMLAEDLDAMQEAADQYSGTVKVQIAGPWTLAASLELRTGERMLRDQRSIWDLTQALADAVVAHVADVRRRLSGASGVLVQFDEPSLAGVLAGRIGTASGLSSYRAVDEQDAGRVLRHVLDAVAECGAIGGVHCCAPDAPIDLLRAAGAGFIGVDLTLALADRDRDARDRSLGTALESGIGLHAGSVPALAPADLGPGLGDARASAPLRGLLSRLGLADPMWLDQIAVTPSCGLAGASPAWVRHALAACRAVGRVVRDESDDGPD